MAEFSDPLTQGDQTRPDFDRTLRPSCVQTLQHVRLQPSRRLIKCPDSCLHNDNSSPPRDACTSPGSPNVLECFGAIFLNPKPFYNTKMMCIPLSDRFMDAGNCPPYCNISSKLVLVLQYLPIIHGVVKKHARPTSFGISSILVVKLRAHWIHLPLVCPLAGFQCEQRTTFSLMKVTVL